MHPAIPSAAALLALVACSELSNPFDGDQDRCAGMGFRVNTPAMADCVMTLRLRREDQHRQQPPAVPTR